MRLQAPQLSAPFPLTDESGLRRYFGQLARILSAHLSEVTDQVNAYSEGAIRGATNAATSAPTTGTYSAGDFIRNSNPSEITPQSPTYDALGSAESGAYVIFGWVCVASGTPGTWRQCRYMTGN